ncbi:MAG: hypothetical protein AAF191_15635 [Verrucomicrobiota bacterium]
MKYGIFVAMIAWLLAAPVASLGEEVRVSDYTFETGDAWENVTSGRPMRAAELKFDAEGDDDPVAVFFYFGPGQGGGLEANVDRWKGQFDGGPSAEEREDLEGGGVYLVLTGTYMESMGGPFAGPKTPKPEYKMLAAVLPSEQGAVYIKMTAPAVVADEARAAFEDLVKKAEKG